MTRYKMLKLSSVFRVVPGTPLRNPRVPRNKVWKTLLCAILVFVVCPVASFFFLFFFLILETLSIKCHTVHLNGELEELVCTAI